MRRLECRYEAHVLHELARAPTSTDVAFDPAGIAKRISQVMLSWVPKEGRFGAIRPNKGQGDLDNSTITCAALSQKCDLRKGKEIGELNP